MSTVTAAVTVTVPGSIIEALPTCVSVFAFVSTVLTANVPGKVLPAGTCWQERLCTGSATCVQPPSRCQVSSSQIQTEGLVTERRVKMAMGRTHHT